ncbi:hypothetical protein [Emticicia soli]|uniref:Uncharacterized protein n=1 Tax=Emticicia soli TaxID=2027878 RepID=A0ABW5JEM3_9BACT
MKLQNLDSAVINFLNAKPFLAEDGNELTFRRAIVLAAITPTEERESDEKKFKKYMLATALQRDTEPEVSTIEVSDIRAGSAMNWPVAIHGAIVEYLENQARK